MLKVADEAWCADVTVTQDAYIPLSLTWDVPAPSGVLYVFLAGGSGGYVELKFTREDFALHELIVVDTPPSVDEQRGASLEVPVHRNYTPCVSPATWKWRENPDYREIAEEATDETCEFLSLSRSPERYTLRILQHPPVKRLSSGAVAVGISSADAICEVAINLEGSAW